jgi:FkbM family methyltransferase
MNFFYGKRRGFYVDIGANAPRELSNSYFFDRCLGWRGICIEASPTRAQELRAQRSCEVVENCVFSGERDFKFSSGDDTVARIRGAMSGDVTVRCRRLADILRERGVAHIDLMSLDVKSAEIHAIQGADFEAHRADVLLVETFWTNRTAFHYLYDRGYSVVADLGVDTAFARRGVLLPAAPGAGAGADASAAPHWVPKLHKEWREVNNRNLHDTQAAMGNPSCIDDSANSMPNFN